MMTLKRAKKASEVARGIGGNELDVQKLCIILTFKGCKEKFFHSRSRGLIYTAGVLNTSLRLATQNIVSKKFLRSVYNYFILGETRIILLI